MCSSPLYSILFFLCSGNGRIGAHSHKKSGEKYGKHCLLLRVRKKAQKGTRDANCYRKSDLVCSVPFFAHPFFLFLQNLGRTNGNSDTYFQSYPLCRLIARILQKLRKLLSRRRIVRRLPNRLSPDTMTSHRIMNNESLFQQRQVTILCTIVTEKG